MAVDPWIGRVIDHRYRVLSLIGSGGMGLIYQVEHIQLGKIAAMKVLHADTARDTEAVRRFRTEAQAVSRLNHPNIVQTFDFGQADGALYLVMELVRGDDLALIVKRDGPMPFGRAARLFVQICSALTDAHEAGIIHRDLKPDNIVVVTRRGHPPLAKVLDFGLAKLRERSDLAEVTSRGDVIGTPSYMSPEQVRSEILDARTDVYSLGATLYRVLTGTAPFHAATPVGVLAMHIAEPLELPRIRAPGLSLPAAADQIVARAMAKAREDRHASAAELQHDLETALRDLHEVGGDTARASARADGMRSVSPEAVAAAGTAKDAGPDLSAGRAATVPIERDPQSRGSPRDAGQATAARQVAATRTEEYANDASGDDGGFELGSGVGLAVEREPESRSGSGERLRRHDFDAFERSLRRRKRVALLVVPLVLVVGLVAGIWTLGRGREKGSSVEREPNDSPANATLLPLDVSVMGRIGKRQSGGQPDMDYFRVPPGKGARVVSARIEGIPGVDLVLELFDAGGLLLAKSDAHGAGAGEWLQPEMIGRGEAFLLVRQIWIQGTTPLEDVADPYRLSVHWGPYESGWEVEPNDWRDHANIVEPGQAVKGYLGSAEDKDWFSFTWTVSGFLVGRITAPGGVDIAVRLGDAAVAGRSGQAVGNLEALKIPLKSGVPTLIELSRKLASGVDPKSQALEGLDAPYQLKLDFSAR
jgi:serine/threonine protein kinase